LESEDHNDHQGMLESKMEAWFRRKGKAVPKGIYFTKEQMKHITSIKFSPGGAIGVLETAANGVSPSVSSKTSSDLNRFTTKQGKI
jgi:hypothetical protein